MPLVLLCQPVRRGLSVVLFVFETTFTSMTNKQNLSACSKVEIIFDILISFLISAYKKVYNKNDTFKKFFYLSIPGSVQYGWTDIDGIFTAFTSPRLGDFHC